MRLSSALGRKLDIPMLEGAAVAAQSAGSAADASALIALLPDLALGDAPANIYENASSMLPINRMRLRQVDWMNNAANRAGNATHWYDWQLRAYRKGVLRWT